MCHYDDTYCTEVKRENKKKEEKDGDLDGVVEMGGETARVLYEGADIHVAACRHYRFFDPRRSSGRQQLHTLHWPTGLLL